MKARGAVFLLLAGLFAACLEAPTGPPEPLTALPRALSSAEQQLVQSNNQFALKVFQEISGEEPDGNLFISPLSVEMALAMAYNGARGATRDSMARVLALDGLSLDQADQSFLTIIQLLQGLDPSVQYSLGNAIWYKQGFQVDSGFVKNNLKYFNAQVSPLDFTNPASVSTVNNWVSKATNDRIPSIVTSFDPYTVMYLANAIYFKARWTTQFKSDQTRSASFKLPSGSTIQVPTMTGMKEWKESFYGGSIAADLPYGNTAFSMTVVLPASGTDVLTLIQGFGPDQLSGLTSHLTSPDRECGGAELYLPKFQLQFGLKMNQVLSALGMGIAFGPGADFTGISPDGGLEISEVQHKAWVDVNEEGTEAAAATGVGVVALCGGGEFQVNRPFLFIIRERFSGTILFMGRVVDPTKS